MIRRLDNRANHPPANNQLKPAADDGIEEIIKERGAAARAAIERMSGKPGKPN